ncbi:LysR family transcriptional regulator [Rhizobium rhizosphaerae]|uniref:LysR family transcriptional regulator n=1 Tax=Xaviernesmea rhizosphaerae TaxID=1672749 RepID=A0ABX3P8T7_9HYPH|nr:LysR family transcriptional regulator [Xaviernesmea rhizosphaerae]OQP83907.1 LysR family transcriptional regulator [Xaviernesmea rhizosphaerae]
MNWDDLRHFGALVQAGSLSEAARRLNVEHATVARRIAALEAELTLTLVDRRGRRWVPTADGLRIAEIARRMETEAQAIRRAAQGAQRALMGTVTISAPPALAAARLAAPLVALQNTHPGLTIRLIGEVRSASLARAEADMAIRLSRPQEGDLTITRIGRMGFRLYAAPSFLAAHGPEDWRFIGNDGALTATPQQEALETAAAGRPIAMTASSVEIQHAVVRAAGGIALLPDFLGAEDPALIPVPPGKEMLSRDIFLLVHSELRRAAPIQAVAAALKTAFRQAPSGGHEEEGPAKDGSASGRQS